MAPNSAVRNGQAFTLIKLISWNQHCTKGCFFVNLTQITADAKRFLPEFLYFGGNSKVYGAWEMAAKTIAPLLQTVPSNIHPDFKPSSCRQRAYSVLLHKSILPYCECNNDECEVNKVIFEYLKVLTLIFAIYKYMSYIINSHIHKEFFSIFAEFTFILNLNRKDQLVKFLAITS